MTPGTVCKWRGRFIQKRLDGLYDEPRPGAKRSITDDQVEQVIIRTLETTPRGATHWSTRDMAKAVGRSHMAISRIWHTFGLQPHRDETFKLSNDPLLIEKVSDIVGLYLQPRPAVAVEARHVATVFRELARERNSPSHSAPSTTMRVPWTKRVMEAAVAVASAEAGAANRLGVTARQHVAHGSQQTHAHATRHGRA